MNQIQAAWAIAAVIGLAVTATSAAAQGNGNGNGNGNRGGGGGGQAGIYSPVLVLNGHRFDIEPSPSWTVLGDGLTSSMHQSEQIVPSDGSGREPLFALSRRGDLSPRQGNDPRYILDVRLSDIAPTALVCLDETEGAAANPTWWYVPSEDDGVDTELVPDLSGWSIFRTKWSRDLEWVAVDGMNPGGIQGIFVWDVSLSPTGVPLGAVVSTTPLVTNAVDPTWGDGRRLSFVKDDDANALGELWVWNLTSGSLTSITTEIAIPGSSAVQNLTNMRDRTSISPDGARVAYTKFTASDRTDIFVSAADGTGTETQVTSTRRVKANGYYLMSRIYAPTWSPDGQQLAFAVSRWNSFQFPDTWRITIAGNTKAKKLTGSYNYTNGSGNVSVTGGTAPVTWRN